MIEKDELQKNKLKCVLSKIIFCTFAGYLEKTMKNIFVHHHHSYIFAQAW